MCGESAWARMRLGKDGTPTNGVGLSCKFQISITFGMQFFDLGYGNLLGDVHG